MIIISKSAEEKRLNPIQLFLFTMEEYIKFRDYFSVKQNHSLYEGYSTEEYVAVQTKLMILRKYGSKNEAVYLGKIINSAKEIYPEHKDEFDMISLEFASLQRNEMETFLADGTKNNLYTTIEDVMYGIYLHADENRIKNITKIDTSLLFTATRTYVEKLEKLVLDTYEVLNSLTSAKIERTTFEKAPVISVNNDSEDVQAIQGSPFWSNLYGKDASDEDTQKIINENSLEDNFIILQCCEFISEVEKENYSIKKLEKYVFPPTRSDWGDFSNLHEAIVNAHDVGWSTRVRYNEAHDMAYVQLMEHVQGAFTIDHPHVISQNICVITLVYEKKYGWKIFQIGDRAEWFKETISIREALRRVVSQFKDK